ncbi:MAG: hypothetical protein Q7S08_04900 [bacterium]|nr:hypothetical protein [bacterium]
MGTFNWIKNTVPLLVIGGAIVVALLIVFSDNEQPAALTAPSETVSQSTASAGYESQTDSQGIVGVTVTPLELSATASVWKFNVVLDTHSGSLDEDMLTSAALVDDSGKVYRPTNWDGAPPGGHHREGVLSFMPSISVPQAVQLKILNIGVPERNFTWTIK